MVIHGLVPLTHCKRPRGVNGKADTSLWSVMVMVSSTVSPQTSEVLKFKRAVRTSFMLSQTVAYVVESGEPFR